LSSSDSFHSIPPHQPTDFTDQVVRTNGVNIDIGKLLYEIKDSVTSVRDSPTSTVMARWMVSIEESSLEEDISEDMLGRVLVADGAASVESNSVIIDGSHSTVSTSNSTSNNNNNNASTTTASDTNTKKAVTAVKVLQDRKHHSSSTVRRNNQVISPKRAARTRSSATDPSELYDGVEEVVLPPTKRRTTRKNGTNLRLQAGETSVDKVPLLTGTLYLYRGRSRRAEFIRHK
jgi:hypothetical protein